MSSSDQVTKSLLFATIRTVCALLVFGSTALAQTRESPCTTTITDKARNNVVNAICIVSGDPNSPNRTELSLSIDVVGAVSGVDTIDLVIKNNSDETIAFIRPKDVAIQDENGRAFGLICDAENDCDGRYFVVPRESSKLPLKLDRNIPLDIANIRLLITNVTYITNDNANERLLGFIQWEQPIEVPELDLASESAAEASLDLSCYYRTVLEDALKVFGHDPGVVDGTFSDETRVAIKSWQEDGGRPDGVAASGFLSQADIDEILDNINIRGRQYVNFQKVKDILGRANVKDLCPGPNGFGAFVDDLTLEEAKELQRQMRRLGFYGGPIDGGIGAGSARAVSALADLIGFSGEVGASDLMIMIDHLKDMPPPPNCAFMITHFGGELMDAPGVRNNRQIAKVPSGVRYKVVTQQSGFPGTWFLIKVDNKFGWVNDSGHISLRGPDCYSTR